MRTSALPSTSRRPVTTSIPAPAFSPGNRSCSRRCRGISAWLGVVDRSFRSQTLASTIAEGMCRWSATRNPKRIPPHPSIPRNTTSRRHHGTGCAAWPECCRRCGNRPCSLPLRTGRSANHRWSGDRLQVAPGRLLPLDRLEQRLEVALAEPERAVPFDEFEEDRRPVAERLGEDLQQVPVLVPVDQDAALLQFVDGHPDVPDPLW